MVQDQNEFLEPEKKPEPPKPKPLVPERPSEPIPGRIFIPPKPPPPPKKEKEND